MSEIMEQDFLLFANKASQLLDDGESEKALHLCEAGVKRFPFYGQGHFVMGLCYLSLNQAANAKNEFERTLVYEPNHTAAMRQLADLGKEAGFSRIADNWLLKAAIFAPGDESLVEMLKENGTYGKFAGVDKMADSAPDDADSKQVQSESDEAVVKDETVEVPPVDDTPPVVLNETPSLDIESSTDEEDDKVAQLEEENIVIDEDPSARFDPAMGDDNLASRIELPVEESAPKENHEASEDNVNQDISPISENPLPEDKPKTMDLSSFAATEKDFSSFMDDYLDDNAPKKESNEDAPPKGDWLGAEDLIVEEKDDSQKGDDPARTFAKNEVDETRQLLEELSMDDSDIDLSLLSDEKDDFLPDTPTADNDDDLKEETSKESEKQEIEAQEEPKLKKSETINNKNVEPPAVTEQDDDDVTIDKLMKNPNLVTPTFGEILIAQRKFSEARHVFTQLAQLEPDNPKFAKKILFLDKFLEASKD